MISPDIIATVDGKPRGSLFCFFKIASKDSWRYVLVFSDYKKLLKICY